MSVQLLTAKSIAGNHMNWITVSGANTCATLQYHKADHINVLLRTTLYLFSASPFECISKAFVVLRCVIFQKITFWGNFSCLYLFATKLHGASAGLLRRLFFYPSVTKKPFRLCMEQVVFRTALKLRIFPPQRISITDMQPSWEIAEKCFSQRYYSETIQRLELTIVVAKNSASTHSTTLRSNFETDLNTSCSRIQ